MLHVVLLAGDTGVGRWARRCLVGDGDRTRHGLPLGVTHAWGARVALGATLRDGNISKKNHSSEDPARGSHVGQGSGRVLGAAASLNHPPSTGLATFSGSGVPSSILNKHTPI